MQQTAKANKVEHNIVYAVVERYLGEKLRVIVWDVVQHCISKGAFELNLAIGWAAAKGGKQVQTGSDGGLHQRQERKALEGK